jgi:hypothetical protein
VNEIFINNNKYIIKHDKDKITLKTYDDQYKMWVALEFPLEGDKEIDKTITQMLSDAYIQNCLR